jgi:GT2 family glycosyltransferase
MSGGHRDQSKAPPRVHAVLLNWSSYDFTAACIASLKKSEYPFSRIIVVDNYSTDDSCDRLQQEFADPQVVFIRNPKNVGFAGGMNIGFARALALGADMVFSVNNDTEIDPLCLGFLVEALESDSHAGVSGPAIMYHKNPTRIWQAGGHFSRLRGGVVVPLKGRDIRELGGESTRVEFLSGCAVLIRKSVLETVGFFDTSYFFYSEDLDYDLRVLKAGKTLVFVPKARLWHKIEEVAKERTSPYVLYHLARSTVLVYRRHFRPPYRWYAVLLQFVLYTPFRVVQIVKGGAGSESLVAWLKGLWTGMAENPAPAQEVRPPQRSLG